MKHLVSATLLKEGGEYELIDLPNSFLAGHSGGLIELRYGYHRDLLPPADTGSLSLWRYRALLPLAEGSIRYPLAVGGTPLLASPGLRKNSGVTKLWVKDETRSPTGSNKDRATALVLEWALREGAGKITTASTGNVAVSLAVGAAAAGLEAVIFVPADVREAKLRLMLLAGATVFKVAGGYEAAFQLSRRAAQTFGWCDRNTGSNPLTVEAKKTVAFEIWEQLGRRMPDVVVVPVGDGTTLSAMHKGFWELVQCGAGGQAPRLLGVQAEGCQPLKCAWEGREPRRESWPGTIADGISVDSPVNRTTALRDVRASRGAFVSVSDDAIMDAIRDFARFGGVLAEPAAAASLAGLRAALLGAQVNPTEEIVLLVTGNVLKTPQYVEPTRRAFEVGDDLEEVRKAALTPPP